VNTRGREGKVPEGDNSYQFTDEQGIPYGWIDSKNVFFDRYANNLKYFYLDGSNVKVIDTKIIDTLIKAYNNCMLKKIDPSFKS
jgi:hypothetical protein